MFSGPSIIHLCQSHFPTVDLCYIQIRWSEWGSPFLTSSENKVLSPNAYRTRSPTRCYHFYSNWGVHGTLLTSTKQGLGSPLISLWNLVYVVPAVVFCGSIWVSLKLLTFYEYWSVHLCQNKVIAKPPWRTMWILG